MSHALMVLSPKLGLSEVVLVYYDDQSMYQMQMQPYMQPRVTKAEVKSAICNYCFAQTNMPVVRTVTIEDAPLMLPHACAGGGIQLLQQFNFPVEAWGICVPFYYCGCCGELVLVKDSM